MLSPHHAEETVGAYIVVAIVFLFVGAYLDRYLNREVWKTWKLVRKIFSLETSFEKFLNIIDELGPHDPLTTMVVQEALSRTSNQKQYAELWKVLEDKSGNSVTTSMVFEKWNQQWRSEIGRSNNLNNEDLLHFCNRSHPRNPYLKVLLGSILTQDVIEGASLEMFMRIADLAHEFRAERETAVVLAGEYAESVEEVNMLIGRYAGSSSCEDLRSKLNERLATLETRSDELSFIMSNNRVDSEAWKIAFNKLKAMKDPAMETSGTYGAP